VRVGSVAERRRGPTLDGGETRATILSGGDDSLQFTPLSVDQSPMRVWYKNLSSLLGSDESEETSVRQILDQASRQKAVVGLSNSDEVRPDPDCGVLDAVDGDDLVISRHEGGASLIFKPGDRVSIAIAATRGYYKGETEIVSAWTGRDIGLDRCGYRVRIPESIVHSQRRSNERVPVAFDLAPKAVVKSPDAVSQIGLGIVLDLSGTGMRMRVVPMREILLGELLTIEARFSNSIPSYKGLVEVVNVFASRVPDARILGLRFVDERPDIARAIRSLDYRRRGRSAA
jgi:hypothetical protein